jgi:hypothetical protein
VESSFVSAEGESLYFYCALKSLLLNEPNGSLELPFNGLSPGGEKGWNIGSGDSYHVDSSLYGETRLPSITSSEEVILILISL